MANLLYGSENFSTTLNVPGGINNSQTTGIVLTSVSGLDTGGGMLCFDWASTLDTSVAEYIEYGGISGNTLTGVVRGSEGISAKSHSNGCTIVNVISKSQANRINDRLNGTDTTGISPTKVTGKVEIDTSYGAITADTDGATITFDMSVTTRHTVTLGGNRTLAVSNVSVGQCFLLRLLQDGTGSRTVTWFSTIKWAGGSAPTLTTTVSKADMFAFFCTSSGNYDGFIVGLNL